MPAAQRAGSLVELAHDELHRMITDGELIEGKRLVIDGLARRFGTSLIPIREALARLDAEGLVTFERNKGYRVSPHPGLDTLRRLFEARLAIEMGVAELICDRADPAILADLKALNRLMASGSYGITYRSFQEFVTLNERFHVELVGLARNPLLDDAYRRIGYHQQITRPSFGRGVGDLSLKVREHDLILDMLEARDPARLREAIRAHILTGYHEIVASPQNAAAVPFETTLTVACGPRRRRGPRAETRGRKKDT